MNNMDKKIELVSAITALSIEITNNSKIDVFAEYSGHVNSISVKVLLEGWEPEYKQFDFNKILYLDRCKVNDLQEIIDYLKELKGEN